MKNLLFFALFIFTFFSISCNQVEKTVSKSTPMETESLSQPGFIHAVYFWLKKDNPELLKEFIEKGLPELAKVPSIKSVHWGPPAGTPREVVDNSYDMAWIVTFDNAAKQDEYQVDPLHLKFVELYSPLFDRVQVYDSVIKNNR